MASTRTRSYAAASASNDVARKPGSFTSGESDAVFATAVGITPTANLSLAIAAADAAPDVGDTVQVTLTVTNHGPHAATELTVQAVVEAGLIPDSVTADTGSCTTGAAFDCDLEDLAPGASAVIVGMFTAAERGSWLITAEASASVQRSASAAAR